VAVFAYWFVHGSADWLYEFAGLGAPAFAMLGLACALAPRRVTAPPAPPQSPGPEPRAGGGRGARLAVIAGVVIAALAAVVALGAPWLSARYTDRAVHGWPQDPRGAFDDLDRAADLNPLNDRPLLAGGTIALRLGDLSRAKCDFRRALDRKPKGAYAALQLGAIASAQGQRERAERLLALAADLNPRDPATKAALRAVRAGHTVSIAKLEQVLVRRPRELGR
jgi:tetratricopeptide (TPR) repeat protein